MVNEESSAKSLHFMVEKGAKPTVRMFMNILKAVAPIRPLTSELPYASGVALKKQANKQQNKTAPS